MPPRVSVLANAEFKRLAEIPPPRFAPQIGEQRNQVVTLHAEREQAVQFAVVVGARRAPLGAAERVQHPVGVSENHPVQIRVNHRVRLAAEDLRSRVEGEVVRVKKPQLRRENAHFGGAGGEKQKVNVAAAARREFQPDAELRAERARARVAAVNAQQFANDARVGGDVGGQRGVADHLAAEFAPPLFKGLGDAPALRRIAVKNSGAAVAVQKRALGGLPRVLFGREADAVKRRRGFAGRHAADQKRRHFRRARFQQRADRAPPERPHQKIRAAGDGVLRIQRRDGRVVSDVVQTHFGADLRGAFRMRVHEALVKRARRAAEIGSEREEHRDVAVARRAFFLFRRFQAAVQRARRRVAAVIRAPPPRGGAALGRRRFQNLAERNPAFRVGRVLAQQQQVERVQRIHQIQNAQVRRQVVLQINFVAAQQRLHRAGGAPERLQRIGQRQQQFAAQLGAQLGRVLQYAQQAGRELVVAAKMRELRLAVFKGVRLRARHRQRLQPGEQVFGGVKFARLQQFGGARQQHARDLARRVFARREFQRLAQFAAHHARRAGRRRVQLVRQRNVQRRMRRVHDIHLHERGVAEFGFGGAFLRFLKVARLALPGLNRRRRAFGAPAGRAGQYLRRRVGTANNEQRANRAGNGGARPRRFTRRVGRRREGEHAPAAFRAPPKRPRTIQCQSIHIRRV